MPGFDRQSARRIGQVVGLIERRPRNEVQRPTAPRIAGEMRVFWTTSPVSSATVTGSTVSTARRVPGTGTARPCTLDSSGNDIPDTSASDLTILNDVVMTTPSSINTGLFVDCKFFGGGWRVVTVHRCPS